MRVSRVRVGSVGGLRSGLRRVAASRHNPQGVRGKSRGAARPRAPVRRRAVRGAKAFRDRRRRCRRWGRPRGRTGIGPGWRCCAGRR